MSATGVILAERAGYKKGAWFDAVRAQGPAADK